MDKSGVSVSGLNSVVVNTAVVTKAGSASYSVARMVASTAVDMDLSSTPARKHKKRPTVHKSAGRFAFMCSDVIIRSPKRGLQHHKQEAQHFVVLCMLEVDGQRVLQLYTGIETVGMGFMVFLELNIDRKVVWKRYLAFR